MKVSLNWMREFTPIDLSPGELRDLLDDIGLVVDSVTLLGEGLDDVVVSQVVSIEPIDGATKIRKITVFDGTHELEIVCGAWNFQIGDKVPLARIGAVLPGGFEISKRKLKGVESYGMLCSVGELALDQYGFSGDDGIMILDTTRKEGELISKALSIIPDVVFDLALEPNRPDALSIVGVARDISARLGTPFSVTGNSTNASEDLDVVLPQGSRVAPGSLVRVDSNSSCGRFGAWRVDDVKVGQSSRLIQSRLLGCGMRPINAVVDISNYLMIERGQPSHPYDLNKLGQGSLQVRLARKGETIVTLDGLERSLSTQDTVICDGDDWPVGIAGVMGGQNSQIDAATHSLLIEVANFSPQAIGRTAKRLGLRSDASVRFERGADPNAIEPIGWRFVELLVSNGVIGPVNGDGPLVTFDGYQLDHPVESSKVTLRLGRYSQITGSNIDMDEAIGILGSLDFRTRPTSSGDLTVEIPTFRPDCEREIDIIEELIRIKGYSTVTRSVPASPFVGGLSFYQSQRRLLRQVMSLECKAIEATTLSLVERGDAGYFTQGPELIELENPLSKTEAHLRQSMIPGLLRAISYNLDRGNSHNRLFEIGHNFVSADTGSYIGEREVLCYMCDLDNTTEPSLVVSRVMEVLRVLGNRFLEGQLVFEPTAQVGFRPGMVSKVVSRDRVLGLAGEIDPTIVSKFGLRNRRVGAIELETGWSFSIHDNVQIASRLLRAQKPAPSTAWIPSSFPSSQFDLAFIVPREIQAQKVSDYLLELASKAITYDGTYKIKLYDAYSGKDPSASERSLTYSVRLEPANSTLTDQEISTFRSRLIDGVEQAGLGKLRDFQ